jgi:hypothetical protein
MIRTSPVEEGREGFSGRFGVTGLSGGGCTIFTVVAFATKPSKLWVKKYSCLAPSLKSLREYLAEFMCAVLGENDWKWTIPNAIKPSAFWTATSKYFWREYFPLHIFI